MENIETLISSTESLTDDQLQTFVHGSIEEAFTQFDMFGVSGRLKSLNMVTVGMDFIKPNKISTVEGFITESLSQLAQTRNYLQGTEIKGNLYVGRGGGFVYGGLNKNSQAFFS